VAEADALQYSGRLASPASRKSPPACNAGVMSGLVRVGEALRWIATGETGRAEATPAELEDEPTLLQTAIARAVESRIAGFTFADALAIPAVARSIDLLASQAAALSVAAYRDGVRLDVQPRQVSRPTPWPEVRRRDFLYETVYSLLAAPPDGGNAYWLVLERGDRGYPAALLCADPSDMAVRWDELRLRRRYSWRGQDVDARDVTHIRIGARPGDVLGHSPIADCLPRLAIIGAAEAYAAGFFASGGLPEVVIRSGVQLDDQEAIALRNQYIGDGERFPVRVVSGDLDLAFPAADPERSQMAQTRAYAATEVARLLGIPASLLMVETSGATITYTNPQGALDQLYRETLLPTYLNPIESAWSDLVPGTQAVRFELNELLAADVQTRAQVQLAYLAADVLTAPEVRAMEGWPNDRAIEASPRLEPTSVPADVTLPTYLEETA
jgi:HK97 family phage portal protein